MNINLIEKPEDVVRIKRHHAYKPKKKEDIEKVKEFKAFYAKQMISLQNRYIALECNYKAMNRAIYNNLQYIDSDLLSRLKEFLNGFKENLTGIKKAKDDLTKVYKEITNVFNIFPRLIDTDMEDRHELEEIIDEILFDIEDCEESWAREADLFFYEIENKCLKAKRLERDARSKQEENKQDETDQPGDDKNK